MRKGKAGTWQDIDVMNGLIDKIKGTRRLAFGVIMLAVLLFAGSAGAIPLEQWNKTFGKSDRDAAYSVQQTSDGGFIIADKISSYDAEGHWIGDDAWLVKVIRERVETTKAHTAGMTEKASP